MPPSECAQLPMQSTTAGKRSRPAESAPRVAETLSSTPTFGGLSVSNAVSAVWVRVSSALLGEGATSPISDAALLLARLKDVGLGVGHGLHCLPRIVEAARKDGTEVLSDLNATPTSSVLSAYAGWAGFVNVSFDSYQKVTTRAGGAVVAAVPSHGCVSGEIPAGTVDDYFVPYPGHAPLAPSLSAVDTSVRPPRALDVLFGSLRGADTPSIPLPPAFAPPIPVTSFFSALLALGAGDALVREGWASDTLCLGMGQLLCAAANGVSNPCGPPLSSVALEDALVAIADVMSVNIAAHALASEMTDSTRAPSIAVSVPLGSAPGVFSAPPPKYRISSTSLIALASLVLRLCVDPVVAGQATGVGGPGTATWEAADPEIDDEEVSDDELESDADGDEIAAAVTARRSAWRFRDKNWEAGDGPSWAGARAGPSPTPALAAMLRLLATVCDVLAVRMALSDAREVLRNSCATARRWPACGHVDATSVSSREIDESSSTPPGWAVNISSAIIKWALPAAFGASEYRSIGEPTATAASEQVVSAAAANASAATESSASLARSRTKRTNIGDDVNTRLPAALGMPFVMGFPATPHGFRLLGVPGTTLVALSSVMTPAALGSKLAELGAGALGALLDVWEGEGGLGPSVAEDGAAAGCAGTWRRCIVSGYFPEGDGNAPAMPQDEDAAESNAMSEAAEGEGADSTWIDGLRRSSGASGAGGRGGKRKRSGTVRRTSHGRPTPPCDGDPGVSLIITHTLPFSSKPYHIVTWLDSVTASPSRCLRIGPNFEACGGCIRFDEFIPVRLALSADTRTLNTSTLPPSAAVAAYDKEGGYSWIGAAGWVDNMDTPGLETVLRDVYEDSWSEVTSKGVAAPVTPPHAHWVAASSNVVDFLAATNSDDLFGLARSSGQPRTLLSPLRSSAARSLAHVGLAVESKAFPDARLALAHPRTGCLAALSALLGGAVLGGDPSSRNPRARLTSSSTFGALGAAAAQSMCGGRVYCVEPPDGAQANSALPLRKRTWLALTPVAATRSPLATLSRRVAFLGAHTLLLTGEHRDALAVSLGLSVAAQKLQSTNAAQPLSPSLSVGGSQGLIATHHSQLIVGESQLSDLGANTHAAAPVIPARPANSLWMHPSLLYPPSLTPDAIIALAAIVITKERADGGVTLSQSSVASGRSTARWARLVAITTALRVVIALQATHCDPVRVAPVCGSDELVATFYRDRKRTIPVCGEGVASGLLVSLESARARTTVPSAHILPVPLLAGPPAAWYSTLVRGGELPNTAGRFSGFDAWYRAINPVFATPAASSFRMDISVLLSTLRPLCAEDS